MTSGDSLSISSISQGTFRISNWGSPTEYDLHVTIHASSTDTSFYHANIELAASSSQIIQTDWRNNNDSLRILVDNDMSGQPDDTLNLPNQGVPGCCVFKGDVNRDGEVDISDLVYLVEYSFSGGPGPQCEEEADVNGDGAVDVSDLVYLVDYSFYDGPGPKVCP